MFKIVRFFCSPITWVAFVFIFWTFLIISYAPDANGKLDLTQRNTYIETYTDKFYEITCYDVIGNITFHDWSETELVPYSDRLEYLSATTNRVESIYNSIVCKCTPPPKKPAKFKEFKEFEELRMYHHHH